MHFGATEEEAVALLAKTNFQSFNKVFSAFGFFEAHRTPEDADKYPLDPYTPLPPEEWSVERLRRVRYSIAGAPDQVKYMIDKRPLDLQRET